ncbi:MAG TPA: DUF2147 domain-containing protein [Pseudorhodoplanes sp.]|jgi:uncharacterized protein (DUF2147 family)|nr:DUF2147 domain-containing protein [Pseudorhodoplanes sp.]
MKSIAVIAACAASLMLSCLSARAEDPSGIWLTEEKDAKIHITKCGSGYCGTIVWLARPIDPDTGKPSLDKQNPDPTKRKRPIMGLTILSGMFPTASNKWSGPIYNADDGNKYDGHLSVAGPNALKVEGCLFNVCQAQTWTRTTN